MPFENRHTFTFTAVSVQKNAPTSSGTYGLSSAREWIYVGQSDNIQRELLRHLEETGTARKDLHPTGFTFELCPPEMRNARQERLIQELEPVCNRGLDGLLDAGSRILPAEAQQQSGAIRRRL